MFEKVVEYFFENTRQDFVSIGIPTIVAGIFIFLLWASAISLTYFFKTKAIQWAKKQNEDYTLGNIFPLFCYRNQRFIRKNFLAIRWVLSIDILFILFGIISKSLAYDVLNAKYNEISSHIDMTSVKIVANYFTKASEVFFKMADLLFITFITILAAIWIIKGAQYFSEIIVFHSRGVDYFSNSEREIARHKTLSIVINNVLKVLISIVAAFTILQNFGVNINALLATAGIASLALGLGAQTLVKDYIGGFFIIFENQFAVGDFVEINSFSGVVESVNLRIVKLRTNEGSLSIIPNGDIRSVKNYTTESARVDINICIPITANLQLAALILKEEGEKFYSDYKREIKAPPDIKEYEKVVDFENKSNAVKFRIFINTNYDNKYRIENEFNKRIIARFVEKEIFYVDKLDVMLKTVRAKIDDKQ